MLRRKFLAAIAALPILKNCPIESIKEENPYSAHIQNIKVSTNLGREEIFELGRKGPYCRLVNFPVKVIIC